MAHRRHSFVIMTSILAACSSGPVENPNHALVAAIDSVVELTLSVAPVPGISIAVLRGDDTIAIKGYGVAQVENRVAVTDHTVFRIASVTKQFTAAAVMRLVENGDLRLDATVGDVLPEYRGPGRSVMIHQLLNHTSGVPNDTRIGSPFWDSMERDLTPEKTLEIFAQHPLEFDPGSRWAYSNSGYYLLGLVIERLTGESFAGHLDQTVLEPLGLTRTGSCSHGARGSDYAYGYELEGGHLVSAQPIGANDVGAAGGLCSTPRELVQWARALEDGQVVRRSSYDAMTSQAVPGGTLDTYGFGLELGWLEGHAVVSHLGAIDGYSASLAHYPDDSLTIAVLANGPTSSSALQGQIARRVLGIR